MPRYYLHVTEGAHFIRDITGVNALGPAEVMVEVLEELREIFEDNELTEFTPWILQLLDERGKVLVKLTIDAAECLTS